MNTSTPNADTTGFSHPDRDTRAPIRLRYPSDLTDRQWARLAPLIPPGPERYKHDPREIINALSYHWRTGSSWRMLPHDFPAWVTVYMYARRWQRQGALFRIRDHVLSSHPAKKFDPEPVGQ